MIPNVIKILCGVLLSLSIATAQNDSNKIKGDTTKTTEPALKLRRGEKLLYSIEYQGIGITFITAGHAYLRVDSALSSDRGAPAYHLVNETWSTPTFSFFYRVHDRSESYVDYQSLTSLAFHKKIEEGGYRHEESVEFDHQKNKAYYSTGQTVDLVPGSKDILLSLFYARLFPLELGKSLSIDNHTDKVNYPLEVKVHKKETIGTVLGKMECLVIEPVLRTPGLFESKGRLLIWLTNDARRIPVLMKSKIIIGSINAVLQEYTPGTE